MLIAKIVAAISDSHNPFYSISTVVGLRSANDVQIVHSRDDHLARNIALFYTCRVICFLNVSGGSFYNLLVDFEFLWRYEDKHTILGIPLFYSERTLADLHCAQGAPM